MPRWPVSEDVDEPRTAGQPTPGRRSAAGSARPSGSTSLRDGTRDRPRRTDGADDPDDHFRPPPPPPLPKPDRIGRFAWAGAVGGPALLVLAALLGLRLEGWVGLLAVGGFMAGFVTLVARMKDRPPPDSGPDDGAVV